MINMIKSLSKTSSISNSSRHHAFSIFHIYISHSVQPDMSLTLLGSCFYNFNLLHAHTLLNFTPCIGEGVFTHFNNHNFISKSTLVILLNLFQSTVSQSPLVLISPYGLSPLKKITIWKLERPSKLHCSLLQLLFLSGYNIFSSRIYS